MFSQHLTTWTAKDEIANIFASLLFCLVVVHKLCWHDFGFFWPPTPLCWHFLWTKRWQRVDIFGPPSYLPRLVNIVCERPFTYEATRCVALTALFCVSAFVLAIAAVQDCCRTKFKPVTKYARQLIYILLYTDMYIRESTMKPKLFQIWWFQTFLII